MVNSRNIAGERKREEEEEEEEGEDEEEEEKEEEEVEENYIGQGGPTGPGSDRFRDKPSWQTLRKSRRQHINNFVDVEDLNTTLTNSDLPRGSRCVTTGKL